MESRDSTAAFERLLHEPCQEKYVLRLYVSGMTGRSLETLARIKAICEAHLPGRYHLDVIDVYQQPQRAQEDQIVATPTLVKIQPAPMRRLVGELLDTDKVFRGLNLPQAK